MKWKFIHLPKNQFITQIKKYDVLDKEYHNHIENWINEVMKTNTIEEFFEKQHGYKTKTANAI